LTEEPRHPIACEKILEILDIYQTWIDAGESPTDPNTPTAFQDARDQLTTYLTRFTEAGHPCNPVDIEALLQEAQGYFDKFEYITPPGANAFELYQQVLAREPANATACAKIKHMRNVYAGWIITKPHLAPTFRKRLDRLTAYLGRMAPDANHPCSVPPAVGAGPTTAQIEEWLTKADKLFSKKSYLAPERENAFFYYRKVLEVDPAHTHALQQMQVMQKNYEIWKRSAEADGQTEKAQQFQERLATIAFYRLRMRDRFVSTSFCRICLVIRTRSPHLGPIISS